MSNNIYAIDFGTCNFKVFSKSSGKIVTEKNTIAVINKNQIYATNYFFVVFLFNRNASRVLFFMPVFIQALHKFSIYIPSLIDRDDQI